MVRPPDQAVRARNPVGRLVADDRNLARHPPVPELHIAGEHVVDPLVESRDRIRQIVGVAAGVSGRARAHRAPQVGEPCPGDDLVHRGSLLVVQVAQQHDGGGGADAVHELGHLGGPDVGKGRRSSGLGVSADEQVGGAVEGPFGRDPAAHDGDALGHRAEVQLEIVPPRRPECHAVLVHEQHVVVAHRRDRKRGIDALLLRGHGVMEPARGQGVLQNGQEVLVDHDRLPEQGEVHIDGEDLLQSDDVRPLAGDAVGQRGGAVGKAGSLEGLDRREQRRQAHAGVGVGQGGGDEVGVEARVQILGHDDQPVGRGAGCGERRVQRCLGTAAAEQQAGYENERETHTASAKRLPCVRVQIQRIIPHVNPA